MEKRYRLVVVLFIAAVIVSCSIPSMVSVKVLKPPAIDMPGIKSIAIVDFKGPERAGSQIATLVQSMLIKTGYYDIMERDKINEVLNEQKFTMTGAVDQNTAVEIGKLLGVDAMIFGEVSTYEVEPDKKITKKVKERRGTGKYQWVTVKDKKTGKKKKVKREIYEEVWVDKSYWVRKGTVAINFRVVDVETGRLLAAHSDSKSYDSRNEKRSFFEVLADEQKALKPKGEILNDLSKSICKRFVRMIAPYYVTEKRTIEPGSGSIGVGVRYAENGLWEEALDEWKRAVEETPKQPAAHYDLGLAYEVLGMLDEAEQAYKAAVRLKQKTLYMKALARVRKAIEDQEKLKKQLEERDI